MCSCQQPLEPLFWAFENNRQALYMSANICRPSLPGELRGLAQASAYPVPDGRACSGVTPSPFPSLEHTHTRPWVLWLHGTPGSVRVPVSESWAFSLPPGVFCPPQPPCPTF